MTMPPGRPPDPFDIGSTRPPGVGDTQEIPKAVRRGQRREAKKAHAGRGAAYPYDAPPPRRRGRVWWWIGGTLAVAAIATIATVALGELIDPPVRPTLEGPDAEPTTDALTAAPVEPTPTVVQIVTVLPDEGIGFWQVSGAESLNVRAAPGTNAPLIGSVSGGEIESTGRRADVNGSEWKEIFYEGDSRGWVSANFLAPDAVE